MANDPVSIQYNEELKPLEAVLAGVKRTGDFATHGRLELPMPKVEVEGAGVLSFPVPAAQVAALIQEAVRAPYGRGEETILDLSVRKVWQLPADRVQIGGKSWAASFESILAQVAAGLGCERAAVSAELYKLLIYDEGGFFRAHRDTEKAGGMFGTLVLVLPSAHRGGELLVRHAGREVAVDLSGAEVSEIAFAAFYADCEHEVRPVASGHRVCLVYNLIQVRAGRARAPELTAPDYGPQIAQAAALLAAALGRSGTTTKVAWLLEHHYSPAALAFSALKSADAARAKLLVEAAARANCAVHLALVHIEESGPAEATYHDYEDRYEDYDEGEEDFDKEEEDDDRANDDDFEIVEISDSWRYVDHWLDPEDRAVAFGKLPLDDAELLPQGALDDEKPDKQRLTEATGNEGASFERAYHRAAVVIWRRERYADVLLQAGVGAALPWLEERIAACEREAARSAARREAAEVAHHIITQWKTAPDLETYHYHEIGRPAERAEMLVLLGRLGEAALLEEFVAAVVTRDYDGSETAALIAHLPSLPSQKLGDLVSNLLRQKMPARPVDCLELLQGLISGRRAAASADHDAAMRRAAEAAVEALDGVGAGKRGSTVRERVENLRVFREIDRVLATAEAETGAYEDFDPWPTGRPHRPIDAAFVVNLLGILGELGPATGPALCETAARKIAARPAVFDPVSVIAPALGALCADGKTRRGMAGDAAVEHLWRQSAEFLLQRSEFPPEPPKDWRLDATIGCGCADCRELQAFARDPAERVHRFRVRKDRRQHLHGTIDRHGLEMTHATERKGSPQTLVCTKNRRGYRRRCAQYKQDVAALATLGGLAEGGAAFAATVEKIAAARARYASWSAK